MVWTCECSNGAVKTAFDIQVDGKRGPARPKMTWKQLTEKDCREWKLSAINPHDRHTWRSGVRSAMRAASQLSGRGPTGVDVAPVPDVNQKSNYDYDMIYIWLKKIIFEPYSLLNAKLCFRLYMDMKVLSGPALFWTCTGYCIICQ